MEGRFLIFAIMDESNSDVCRMRMLPMLGCETTADYGMGLVPILHF
jgi:hypothetical protein